MAVETINVEPAHVNNAAVAYKFGKRRHNLLIALVILFVLLSAALLTALLLQVLYFNGDGDICTTEKCTLIGAKLIKSMDLSANPCEDFYSFTCGNFPKYHPLPDDNYHYDVFDGIREENNQKLKILLESLPSSDYRSDAIHKAGLFYWKCKNPLENTSAVIDEVKNFLNSLGGWPIANGKSWKPLLGEGSEGVTRLMATTIRQGFVDSLFSFQISGDLKEPERRRIYLDHPEGSSGLVKRRPFFKLRRSIEEGDENHEDEPAFDNSSLLVMRRLATFFGNNDTEIVEKDIEELFKFTVDLAQINSQDERNLLAAYNKITIRQLSATFDVGQPTTTRVNWPAFFEILFMGFTHIDEGEEIIVSDIQFFQKLSTVLSKYSTRTIYNFVLGKVVEAVSLVLYSQVYSYKPEKRWRQCLSDTTEAFPYVLTRLFSDHHGNSKVKTEADEILETIQAQMVETIRESEWLDPATKKQALLKAYRMKKVIGYPDWIYNDTHLNELYKDVEVNNSHFMNMAGEAKRSFMEQAKDYTKPTSKEEWTGEDPLEVNAYNNIQLNQITIPVGILHSSFFDVDSLAAINYGALGSILGHELGHTFDDKGRQIDERGIIRDWWDKESHDVYEEKTKCFVNQYNQYCPREFKQEDGNQTCLDGLNTLGENIADNVGLRISYEAYERWTKKHGKDKKLTGLQQYSSTQLFFISYGHMWCEHYDPTHLLTMYEDEEHPPGRFRVDGSVSNFPKFASTFKCPTGPMNRGENSCALW